MAIRRDSGLPVESTELRFFKSSIPDKLESGSTCNKDNVFFIIILSTEKESIAYSENMWILLCFMVHYCLPFAGMARKTESKFVFSIMNLPDRLLT